MVDIVEQILFFVTIDKKNLNVQLVQIDHTTGIQYFTTDFKILQHGDSKFKEHLTTDLLKYKQCFFIHIQFC